MTSKARSFLAGCLKVAAGLALVLLLVVAAAVAWSLHANSVADGRAQAFCAASRPGEALAQMLQRAQADATIKQHYDEEGVHHFTWQGGMFYAAECKVKTASGRVVSALRANQDD
jgi:hypothetical protein